MADFKIPLGTGPQTMRVALASITYKLTLRWRDADQAGWILDIEADDGTPLVYGIPLVTGIDLLGQYQHLGFGGALYAITTGDAEAAPTFDSLGVTSFLYFVTP